MKKVILVFIYLIAISITYAETFNREVFEKAYNELQSMANGEKPVDFEKAVFITENAYYNGSYSYEEYEAIIDKHEKLVRQFISSNESKKEFKNPHFDEFLDHGKGQIDLNKMSMTGERQKKYYTNLLSNWAIYHYLTDTITIKYKSYKIKDIPFSYSMNDPFGVDRWENSQTIGMLQSGKGNCYAFTTLYKILSNRLGSESYISTAPQHVYIQHRDLKGNFYNVELPSKAFPQDGSIQTLTYTTRDAVMSGISMRKLDDKQSIGLCLVYLAKAYERRFDSEKSAFMLKCANTALKHDKLNLNAMLLKSQVFENEIADYAEKNNVTTIKALLSESAISETLTKHETSLKTLYNLGYIEMPQEMQRMILAGLQYKDEDPKILAKDYTPKHFADIDRDGKTRYSSLTWGLLEEVHVKKPTENYGIFSFDTKTGKITKIDLEKRKSDIKIDPVVFAMSVDPLAGKAPSWSPYAAMADNPILYTDVTGQFPFTIHIRAFAPPGSFKRFGFGDDKRGFSVSTSKDVTSRISQSFTVDPTAKILQPNDPSSNATTVGGIPLSTATPTGQVTPEFGKNSSGSAVAVLDQSFEGSNPLVPFSPDIEVSSLISLTENTAKGQLFVAVDVSSKGFPATEAIIEDASGQALLLFGAAAFGNPLDLAGSDKKTVSQVDLIIDINDDGLFTGVNVGGKQFTLEEFNTIATSTSAGPNPREDLE